MYGRPVFPKFEVPQKKNVITRDEVILANPSISFSKSGKFREYLLSYSIISNEVVLEFLFGRAEFIMGRSRNGVNRRNAPWMMTLRVIM